MIKLIAEANKIPKNFTGMAEWPNGDKFWYKEGNLHRENGPAIEYADGNKFWYLNDVQYSEQEFNAEIAKRKPTCNGKVVTIDGKQYKLTELT